MNVDRLIEELAALSAQGLGDRRVIDNNGNDVAEVAPPAEPEDHGDEASAVMLHCYIEYPDAS